MSNPPDSPDRLLVQQARERFVAEMGRTIGGLGVAIQERLTELLEQVGSVREMQDRRDAWTLFQSRGKAWEDGTLSAWRQALTGAQAVPPRAGARTLELVGDDVMENQILAARLGMAIHETGGVAYRDLCARVLHLEQISELPAQDVLRPETMTLPMVEQWMAAGLRRAILPLVLDVFHRELATHGRNACLACNAFLSDAGVAASDDLRSRVRRTEAANLPGSTARASHNGQGDDSGAGDLSRASRAAQVMGAEGAQTPAGSDGQSSGEAMSPLARARRRAQGVLSQLRRVLSDQAAVVFESTVKQPVSPTLVEAIDRQRAVQESVWTLDDTDRGTIADADADADADAGPGRVERAAHVLRARSNDLKRQASTSGEKATIEIVALMFQSILAEERIPPVVRVWFARLQLPVLRVALAEPEFFGTLSHPARQLIDRMGSCAMGFDDAAVEGSALEAEIRRVVQVIEQYPETGRRVFQLVYDEFQNFLSKYLTEKGASQRVVSVAQQIEQKETLAIQYTIELRNMLTDIPVRDEVREFLFKVWAEVLALAAVRKGAQDEETIALKRSAADLVWAASAKPNRVDRARVIQSLPQLLQRLRQGMTLLGLALPAQEIHIKRISDTLADAFMSKTEAIPQVRIDQMAARLANLEDFVSDETMGDLTLDADSIEMMLGIDASSIDVIADAGAKPSEAMLAWAHELQLGHWFTLDHNQKISDVQFAWRSERKQLHLFAAMDGRSYLIQAKRLAAYLQAGLLVPREQEALTLRATRQALEKLDANPERLLAA